MKNLSIILSALVVLVSCSQEPKDTYGITIDDSATTQVIGPEAVSINVSFTSGQEWEAMTKADWISLDPNKGGIGSSTLRINVQKNPFPEERSAYVRIICGEHRVYIVDITVTQKEAEDLVIVPKADKFVSSMNISTVARVQTEMPESSSFTFQYDKYNRVTEVKSKQVTCAFDYSKADVVVAKVDGKELEAPLSSDGLVGAINVQYGPKNEYLLTYSLERDDAGFVKKLSTAHSEGIGDTQSYVFTHDANHVWTNAVVNNNYSKDVTYNYNFSTPNINLDLNWLFFSGVSEGPVSLLWLGACGKLSTKLVEMPQLFMKKSRPGGPTQVDKAPGRYFEEIKYAVLGSDVANMTVENDSKNCPQKIVFSMNVYEAIYSYWYNVDAQGHADIEYTVKDEMTTKVLGQNDIIFEFQYK